VPLTKQVIAFAVLRAAALASTGAIAFGLHVTSADYKPTAALVAIKTQPAALRRPERIMVTATPASWWPRSAVARSEGPESPAV
jgi:hypothetical protein